ncbi:MAG: helix-turn-helix domain-containing protein [Gemmatimonadota bacterium]|nr:helix-turn-helix domain-containing protein [Gemmatimonadota bacterium]
MTTPKQDVDLTPFGFTPTESAAYEGLLENGPSSGYGLAGVLGIARANSYQALRGLVAKGAASVEGEDPQVYRAIRPDTLLAKIAKAEEGKLDVLEQQMASRGRGGKEATITFSGERELYAIALRTTTREPGRVACLAPATVLSALVPIWRKRAADGAETQIWMLGDATQSFPIPVAGEIPVERAVRHFGSPVAILTTGSAAGIGRIVEDRLMGLWSSDPTIVGAAQATIHAIST